MLGQLLTASLGAQIVLGRGWWRHQNLPKSVLALKLVLSMCQVLNILNWPQIATYTVNLYFVGTFANLQIDLDSKHNHNQVEPMFVW